MDLTEAKYQTLVESIPGALIFSASLETGNPTNLYIGPQIVEILGFTQEEWLGDPLIWYYQTHPADRHVLDMMAAKLCEDGSPMSVDLRIYSKSNKKLVWFHVEVRVIMRDNVPILLHGIAFDITSRKKAEIAKEEAEKALNEIIYISAHDLQKPVRAINNVAFLVQDDKTNTLSQESAKYMKMIRDFARKMIASLDAILMYLQLGSDCPRIPLDCNKIVQEIWPLLNKKNFKLHAEILPTIIANPVRLKNLFTFLIENAIVHHSRDDGIIKITCKESDDYYEFCIEDDGPGIDPKYHNKLFIIFETLDPKSERLGMGLAFAKKIVNAVGGTIRIESGVDKGAKFFFTWPKLVLSTGNP
jgi:PAS domain S-box-containing protein